MADKIELTIDDVHRMQQLELEMYIEFDRVCRKNHIRYEMDGGTLLGAIRHKGFIPWDDDADIAILREDYEKFKLHAHELDPSICYFQDHETDPGFRWGYGKLRRTGTTLVRVGQDHLKSKTGIFVDIFPMDNAPKSVPGQMLQDFYCFCLRKILWSEVGKKTDKSAFMRVWYSLLSHIQPATVYKHLNKYIEKLKKLDSDKVRLLMFPASGKLYYKSKSLKDRYAMPKKWFTELTDYEFEGYPLMGPIDYDAVLRQYYRDYMELPPEEQRNPKHYCIEIKFPEDEVPRRADSIQE